MLYRISKGGYPCFSWATSPNQPQPTPEGPKPDRQIQCNTNAYSHTFFLTAVCAWNTTDWCLPTAAGQFQGLTELGSADVNASRFFYSLRCMHCFYLLFFFQIVVNSGWVISHHGDRVQVREAEAVVQMLTNGNIDEQMKTVQSIKTRPTDIYISWTEFIWALKLSGGNWQTTGKVFHRQIAVGKKIWLYAFALHWICLYLVSGPLMWAVASWR